MSHPPPPPPLPLSPLTPPVVSPPKPAPPNHPSSLSPTPPPAPSSARLEAAYKKKSETPLDGYEGPRSWTEVPQDLLVVGKAIANGAFGTLHVGEYKGDTVALKMMNAKYIGSYDFLIFYNELQILSSLSHPNILKLIGANTKPNSTYYMILEYIETDLFRYLETFGHELSWQNVANIALGIARGMDHLHREGILQRDLKSSNILLKPDLTPVICDFGTALTKSSTNVKNEATGTPLWMAPEVYMKDKYTEKADVYSFGIILNELVSGVPPFYEREDEDWEILLKEVVTKGARPTIPEFCPDLLRDLIAQCTHGSPALRPSFPEIISTLDRISTFDEFPKRDVQKREPKTYEQAESEVSEPTRTEKSVSTNSNQTRKEVKKRAEKLHLIHLLLKTQNEHHEWTWTSTPFAMIGTDDQVVRAKIRNFLRTVGVFVSEDGPRCDVWTTCIIYCLVKNLLESLNKQTLGVSIVTEKIGGVQRTREEHTSIDEIFLAANLLQNAGKQNWQKDTEQALTIGFTRFFVGLDPRKQIFTTWQQQLLPLASQFVDQYTISKQLIL